MEQVSAGKLEEIQSRRLPYALKHATDGERQPPYEYQPSCSEAIKECSENSCKVCKRQRGYYKARIAANSPEAPNIQNVWKLPIHAISEDVLLWSSSVL
jgi:hypothetical protein